MIKERCHSIACDGCDRAGGGVDFPDPVVVGVCHVEIAGGVDGKAGGVVELCSLAGSAVCKSCESGSCKGCDVAAGGINLPDLVTKLICYITITILIDRDSPWFSGYPGYGVDEERGEESAVSGDFKLHRC